MSEWLTFQEVLKKIEIKDFEIFSYLQNGLQPYKKGGKVSIECPKNNHEYFLHMNQLLRIDPISQKKFIEPRQNRISEIVKDDPEADSWKYLIAPISPDEINVLIDLLSSAYFKKEDVERAAKPPIGPPPWYKWDDSSCVLTIRGTGEQLHFKETGAMVITLFVEADRKQEPSQNFVELNLKSVRSTLKFGDDRDMNSFFQKQPHWNRVLHQVTGSRGLYRFAPPE